MRVRQLSLSLLVLLLVGVTLSTGDDKTCELRPESDTDNVHPADLNADGEVTAEEFQEFAEAQGGADGDGDGGMDADGDGTVTTEEFVAFAEGQDAGPVELTGENFDQMTQGTQAAFVKFMAPWCGHCQTMAKAWSDLAKTVHTKYKGVRVGTVNCDQHRDFCEMFQIRGFPTLLLMKDPEAFEDATPVLFERTVPCYSVRPDPWLYMVPGSYVTSWFHPTASNSGVVNRHSGAEHVPRL